MSKPTNGFNIRLDPFIVFAWLTAIFAVLLTDSAIGPPMHLDLLQGFSLGANIQHALDVALMICLIGTVGSAADQESIRRLVGTIGAVILLFPLYEIFDLIVGLGIMMAMSIASLMIPYILYMQARDAKATTEKVTKEEPDVTAAGCPSP
ncbi:MAG TPA: hypothetical protein VMR98_00255 [Candidatus Polarisedimenticolaceae bacterium]|nr:hypothetical protein [Candidatus Polarisedimenticolaceae bacterium]